MVSKDSFRHLVSTPFLDTLLQPTNRLTPFLAGAREGRGAMSRRVRRVHLWVGVGQLACRKRIAGRRWDTQLQYVTCEECRAAQPGVASNTDVEPAEASTLRLVQSGEDEGR